MPTHHWKNISPKTFHCANSLLQEKQSIFPLQTPLFRLPEWLKWCNSLGKPSMQAWLSKSPVFSGGTSLSCWHYWWITSRTLQNSSYSCCCFTARCYTSEPSPEKCMTLNGKKQTGHATEALQRSGPGNSQHKIIFLSRKERKRFC